MNYAYKLNSSESVAGCSGCQGGMGATIGDDTVGFADYYLIRVIMDIMEYRKDKRIGLWNWGMF